MKILDDIKFALLKESEPTNAIDLLKFDHRAVDALFVECLKTEDVGIRREIIESIIEELAVHAAAEEKLVYPILRNEDCEMAKEAVEEHHVMKLCLAEVADMTGAEDNFKAKVKVLSEIVNTHVLEEEAQMLPKVEKSGVDLQELACAIKSLKEGLKSGMSKIGNTEANQIGGAPQRADAA